MIDAEKMKNGSNLLTCPTCERRYDAAKTSAMPFCSERCRQVDLGKWFNEEYGVPHVPTQEELDQMIDEMSE